MSSFGVQDLSVVVVLFSSLAIKQRILATANCS